MRWILLIWILAFLQTDPYQDEREKMVRTQIQARGITDPHILEAMRKVQRHQLVPKAYRQYAYADRPLPIGNGQTISQPYIVAYMTQLLQPTPGMKVLEIGTGSGYQAAVLAEIVKEVYSIEIVEPLGKEAEKNLQAMGYKNVHLRIGDGYAGWPEEAPFDAIIVTAAAEEIPDPLVSQLKNGGRMIIPVGPTAGSQELILLEKQNGKVKKTNLLPVRFVPFTRHTL